MSGSVLHTIKERGSYSKETKAGILDGMMLISTVILFLQVHLTPFLSKVRQVGNRVPRGDQPKTRGNG